VGTDAWKRYKNKNLAIAFFLLTFFLNFPILVFYFIVRPESKFEDYDEWEAGGVNVPVVNFVGKDGVDMVLQLKINPSKMVPNDNDMRVDVSWESNKENMQLSSPVQTLNDDTQKERNDQKVTNIFSKWRGLAKKKIQKFKEVRADYPIRKEAKKDIKTEPQKFDAKKLKNTESKQFKSKKKKKNKKSNK